VAEKLEIIKEEKKLMNDDLVKLRETAKGLSKNPLGIIALFIVLVYGFAAMVITFASSLTSSERLPLIYFLVIFPVLVLVVFAWLVSCHSGKLYSPSDYRNEDNYIRMQLNAATALATATSLNPQSNVQENDIKKITDVVREASSNSRTYLEPWKNRILWVDDKPENNIYERKAFEALGLTFTLALSTNQALEFLKHNKVATIISDMGRQEGPREGYVLLEALRNQEDKTPFFIYAGSNLPEHKREALERGAQGSTNNAQELFSLVTKAIINSTLKM
jgi:CheY-like chemotaxis protein